MWVVTYRTRAVVPRWVINYLVATSSFDVHEDCSVIKVMRHYPPLYRSDACLLRRGRRMPKLCWQFHAALHKAMKLENRTDVETTRRLISGGMFFDRPTAIATSVRFLKELSSVWRCAGTSRNVEKWTARKKCCERSRRTAGNNWEFVAPVGSWLISRHLATDAAITI